MVSGSTWKVVEHRTSNDKSNNAVSDKENRKGLSSGITITGENNSNFKLLEVREVHHQHSNKMSSKISKKEIC
ncbi:unnamed protein product [Rotaria sp. Silwood2]|nr:unnamed protein product [Rotaria sp. Silwood2]CAF2972695.1 unnamed protein product [Rotaria sp. Silwood2]CAF4070480.1 unnamed protein product [Rotaria sp. Silwood2]CAF4198564.1 unnamed protein product [Rotaria sp. Silwood2]